MIRSVFTFCIAFIATAQICGQDTNYDESKVPRYRLPLIHRWGIPHPLRKIGGNGEAKFFNFSSITSMVAHLANR